MEIKQKDAGDLNVGYVDAGPQDGPAVLLLHGWPYDIHAFDEATQLLVADGFRVIVPRLRGHGTTRFLSDETPRTGEQAVFAVDAKALMDALAIDLATVAGFDWGSRAGGIMAALWPERCTALVAVNGYLIGSIEVNEQPLPPKAELGWWYQYYFATDRGRRGYDFDGPNADGKAYADRFTGPYEHRILEGIGHNVPQEAPEVFAGAVAELASTHPPLSH